MDFCNQPQALEAALPETVSELMSLAAVHAEGGPEHRFVARQLLIIASRCVVRSDGIARHVSVVYQPQLLSSAISVMNVITVWYTFRELPS